MAANPGAFRDQDSIVLTLPGPEHDPHPVWRWRSRAPDAWEDYNVRAAWREGTPIESVPTVSATQASTRARYHQPSGMVLVARWGVLQTTVHIRALPADARNQIRRQTR